MKVVLSLALGILLGQSLWAEDVIYRCTSSGNAPIFDLGESFDLTVEFNSNYMAINNNTGIWNHLQMTSVNDGYAFYRSMAADVAGQTEDLEAVVKIGLLEGQESGPLDLLKSNSELEQHYACKLVK
jgi:hypothetical protein